MAAMSSATRDQLPRLLFSLIKELSLGKCNYFLTAKNTMRRIARRKSRFSSRIKGRYCDIFEGCGSGSSGAFAVGGRCAFAAAQRCVFCAATLCVWAALADQICVAIPAGSEGTADGGGAQAF